MSIFRDETIYKLRANGYSTDYLFDFSIASDWKNSSWRTIYIDQPELGVSREYLIKGLEEKDVRHYYDYMQKVAVMFGADPVRAAHELKESLEFEVKLAKASLPREERRNATALYHPMSLDELSIAVPIINWTSCINNILTPELLQVYSTRHS